MHSGLYFVVSLIISIISLVLLVLVLIDNAYLSFTANRAAVM